MYLRSDGYIECRACLLSVLTKGNMSQLAELLNVSKETHPELFMDFEIYDSVQFTTRTDALKHLSDHVERGHHVPAIAFARLINERENEGDKVAPVNADTPSNEINIIDFGTPLDDGETE